ncbi:MAG: FAD-dependent oxidoreductase [Thermoplasmata archaeon]|nr:MAG: FAD-dependent oxidoreductase [Thermoplasmata archaeon]
MSSNDSITTHSKTGVYDVIVVGGGPGGLSAALYAARADLKTLVIDKNPLAGALGKADKIANYPGVPGAVSGQELLANIKKQAESFGAEFIQTPAVGVNFSEDAKEVMTNEGAYKGKTVIIATGSMGRKPSIPGEADYIGRGVSYCATCDVPFFRDRDVAVVGAVEVMADELDAIAKFAKNIYIVTRTKELSPEHAAIIMDNPKFKLMQSYNCTEIWGEDTVTGIKVADSEGNQCDLEVAGVFMYLTGAKPIVDFLLGALELNSEGCIKINIEDMSTSVPGVFAVGDVTCKQIRQVVVATAEGCIAALSAEKYINARNRVKPQWGLG